MNTVLSQHFIQSFKPGEITPERALEVGKELCEKFLKGEYQYFLAIHTDTDHTHLHVIFNNVNRKNGRTFETNMNRGRSLLTCRTKYANGIIWMLSNTPKERRARAIGSGI